MPELMLKVEPLTLKFWLSESVTEPPLWLKLIVEPVLLIVCNSLLAEESGKVTSPPPWLRVMVPLFAV